MPEKPVRKTAVRKSVRKTATKKAVAKKATTKKTTSRKTTPGRPATATSRKAPTSIAAQKKSSKKVKIVSVIGITASLLIFGTSVVIGTSDSGAINVRDQVNSRLENATDAERRQIERMSAGQEQRNVPDGGLQPSADQSQQVPVVVPESTTATTTSTSTVATATSTEETATSSSASSESEDEVGGTSLDEVIATSTVAE